MTQTKAELLQTRHQGDIRLGDADSTNYVGFKAPATVGSNLVWTLPATDGSADQFLQTNASGVLSWGTADTSASMPKTGGIFTGDVTFTGASANIVFDKSDNALEFADDARAFFGASSDLQIYHNNHNYVKSTNGDLILQAPASNWFYVKTDAGNDNSIIAKNNGAVELYHNNVKKFATSADGIAVTGAATISTNLTVTGDLTVSGTTTTINTQTLDVEDKNVVIGKVSSPSDTTADGGGWTLKGATDKTFNWVNSTDAWTSSEHLHLGDNKKLLLGTGQDLRILHDGFHSYVHNYQGVLVIQNDTTNASNIHIRAKSAENSIVAIPDGAVELYHNSAKKIETTSGGINVTGAINVNGSPLAGGNTVELVADGAIAAGKPVIITSAGKAKAVAEAYTAKTTPVFRSGGIGSVNMSSAYSPIPVYSPTAGHYAFMYRDGDYTKITPRPLNADGTWGANGSTISNVSAEGQYSQHASMCIVPASEISGVTTDRLVIIYRDYPGNNNGYLRIGNINTNNSVSIASGHNEFTNNDLFRSYMQAMGSGRFLLAYSDGSNVYARCAEITANTTYSAGSEVSVGSSTSSNSVWVTEPDSNGKALIVYANSSSALKARAVSLSGTTITLGTEVELNSYVLSSLRECKVAYNKDDDNFLAVFSDNSLKCVAMTISGTTITKSAATQVANIETRGIGVVYDSRLKHFWAHVSRDGNGNDATNYWYPITETAATAPSIGTAKTKNIDGHLFDAWNSLYVESDNRVISVGRNTSSSNEIKLISGIMSDQTSNATANNVAGFASSAISDTATGTINCDGNTVDNQSGLTAGTRYWVQNDGSLGTSAQTTQAGGLALTSSKLLIKMSA